MAKMIKIYPRTPEQCLGHFIKAARRPAVGGRFGYYQTIEAADIKGILVTEIVEHAPIKVKGAWEGASSETKREITLLGEGGNRIAWKEKGGLYYEVPEHIADWIDRLEDDENRPFRSSLKGDDHPAADTEKG